MDFVYSEDQIELRGLLREYVAARFDEGSTRRLMETEIVFDRSQWKACASELGLQGLTVPETYHGLGLGAVELGIVAEELGSALACLPFFSTSVLATTALRGCDDAARSEWLPRIVDGDVVATLAVSDRDGNLDAISVLTQATFTAGNWSLSGKKRFVLDGHTADVLLVAARNGDRVSLFEVLAGAPGLLATKSLTMDQTRAFAEVTLDSTPARMVCDDATDLISRVRDVALAVLSAEQLGGAQLALDIAVEHAKTRMQFGRAIGSFQAIKHKCADMLILIESARAASAYALWCVEQSVDALPMAAATAKVAASEAFVRAAGDTIQVLGGIGFTWEHPIHMHFKRAKSTELWLGTPAVHRDRLAGLLNLERAAG